MLPPSLRLTNLRMCLGQYLIEPANKCPKPVTKYAMEVVDRLVGLIGELSHENAGLATSLAAAQGTGGQLQLSTAEAVIKALIPAIRQEIQQNREIRCSGRNGPE